jgi:prephenate dehydrogenase
MEAPGTTFKKHLNVARGLLSEDDYLLSEILFNPHTANQIEAIKSQMTELQNIVEQKDLVRMQQFLTKVRTNIE